MYNMRISKSIKSTLLFSFAFIIIFSIFLLACGNNKDFGKTKLVFKHGKIAGESKYLTDLITQFESENPNIEVVEEVLPAITDQQRQFYITSLESGSDDFDVLSMDVIWIPEFARAGWLEDLTALFSKDEIQLFFPGPLRADTYQGKLYAMPWYVDAGVLYYRKDLLGKYFLSPPKTFNELKNICRIIKRQERNSKLYGFVWQGKQYEGLICAALEFIEGNCGHILDADGNPIINSPQVINAMSFMRSLIDSGITPEYVTTADEEMTRHSFGNGNVIFMRNWPYAYNIFNAEDSKIKGKVGVCIMPHFDNCPSAATLGGWQLGINKMSKHKKEAQKFISFMFRYESQKYLALNVGLKPSRRDIYTDETLKDKQPFISDLYDILMKAVPRPITPYYPQISQVLQTSFSEIITGSKSAEESLNEAQGKLAEIISRSG